MGKKKKDAAEAQVAYTPFEALRNDYFAMYHKVWGAFDKFGRTFVSLGLSGIEPTKVQTDDDIYEAVAIRADGNGLPCVWCRQVDGDKDCEFNVNALEFQHSSLLDLCDAMWAQVLERAADSRNSL